MADPARIAALSVVGLRLAYGAALLAAPGRLTRTWLGPDGGRSPATVAIRGLAAREIALAVATLAAGARGAPLRPWLAIAAVGDVADIGATLAGRDGVPERSPKATVAVAGGSALITAALALAADRDL